MDPTADLISHLKNSSMAGKRSVVVPHSKFKQAIAELLKEEGFLCSVTKKGRKAKKVLEIELYEEGSSPRISDVDRVSKPSRRVYRNVKEIYPKKHQTTVLSTPQGILTAKQARDNNTGGEELFRIW